MPHQDLTGKRIVITAGRPCEDIDGVRFYANHRRPESQGYAAAAKLASRGAEVIVVTSESSLAPPPGCRVIRTLDNGESILSGRDLMKATESFVTRNFCDAILCLASLASIRPAQRAAHKLKVKSAAGAAVSMAVVGNVDVEARAKAWGVPVVGYDSWQEDFATPQIPIWLLEAVRNLRDLKDAVCPAVVDANGQASFPPASRSLNGKKAIVTSGPTEELVTATGDVITNISSSRQGREVARALALLGAEVVYVVGPTILPPPLPDTIKVIRTASALSMLAACRIHLPADIFVGVAAVADFGCADPKVLRLAENQETVLTLGQNPDILETMGHHPSQRPRFVAGFAAENDLENIIPYANDKLVKKKANLICANLIGRGLAQDINENRIVFVTPNEEPRQLPVMSKSDAALAIAEEISARLSSERARPSNNLWNDRLTHS
jgi:phosphopantothenoylcysteine synthetase/decarboxylase